MQGRILPRILIAEDDPDDRLLINEAFLERFPDGQVRFVQNGEELIELLDRSDTAPASQHATVELPDLILLDLNMPFKDGRTTLVELKGNSGLRQIPVIILTTSANQDDINHCYANGANSYIIKPSLYSELLQVVGNLRSYWVETVKLPVSQVHHEH